MNLALDEYAHLDSPLRRWDPRCKLISLMVLIFAFAFVSDLRMLPAMVVVTCIIFIMSRLPASFMATRLRYPSFFLLALVIVLPFISGQTVVMSIGPLDVRQEGLISVLLITTRFLCILTIGLVIFSTAPFLTTIKAMRALGLPAILTDMILLAFRYLYEIGDDLQRMRTSMKLRGFRAKRFSIHGLGVLASLGGSILVRSYERSEWVYKAMILRGYGHAAHPKDEFRACSSDIIAFGVTLMIAAAFIAGGILFGHV